MPVPRRIQLVGVSEFVNGDRESYYETGVGTVVVVPGVEADITKYGDSVHVRAPRSTSLRIIVAESNASNHEVFVSTEDVGSVGRVWRLECPSETTLVHVSRHGQFPERRENALVLHRK